MLIKNFDGIIDQSIPVRMILRRRFNLTMPIATTILGILAIGIFGSGITLDNESLTVLGLVFVAITLLLVLGLCFLECRRRYTMTITDPPVATEEGMRRNKSDTDLELMTGNAKEDRDRMYEDV